jgi:hypothetical protein
MAVAKQSTEFVFARKKKEPALKPAPFYPDFYKIPIHSLTTPVFCRLMGILASQ